MALAREGRFKTLIMRNQSRLARRQRFALPILHELHDLGVWVFYYQTGQEVKLTTAADQFMVNVNGFQDEAYRESAILNGREIMRQMHKRGDATGPVPFGFDLRCKQCHAPTRPHRTCAYESSIERFVVDPQAEVVRRIFQMIANGLGVCGSRRS
jgi:DNA invertase Pin-like site-specific DNA recombinase